MVEVTQEDRDAAASGYFAWCSGNPVIPDRMKAGQADDHSMVQAFARHRIAAENAALERAVKVAIEAITEAREAPYFHYVEWDGEPEDAVPPQLARSKCDEAIRALKGPSNA